MTHLLRNQRIAQLLLEHHTLQECGDKVGLTRERVRQIAHDMGVASRDPKRKIRIFRPKRQALFRFAFWQLVNVDDEDKCWEWLGSLIGKHYGRFSWRGHNFYAHRLAYTLYFQKTLQEWGLHRCNNPLCCNPLHIYDGNNQDNVNDREEAGRGYFANRFSKLRQTSQIEDILRRNNSGESMRSIARLYNTSATSIYRLIKDFK